MTLSCFFEATNPSCFVLTQRTIHNIIIRRKALEYETIDNSFKSYVLPHLDFLEETKGPNLLILRVEQIRVVESDLERNERNGALKVQIIRSNFYQMALILLLEGSLISMLLFLLICFFSFWYSYSMQHITPPSFLAVNFQVLLLYVISFGEIYYFDICGP